MIGSTLLAALHRAVPACMLFTLVACGSTVLSDPTDGAPDNDHGDVDDDDDDGIGTGATGTPCTFHHGMQTLPSWQGDDGAYSVSLFSFELASNDIAVHRNDGDVLYEANRFHVNTVTDDSSFIVDLGPVALDALPETVAPDDFPTGNWGEHDAIQVVLDHTYVIRTVDGDTRQWAALRVIGLSPGVEVTFEWVRSADPDRLIVPTHCG